jgi:hypothetical protein
MTIQTPTRITIEIHPPEPAGDARSAASEAGPLIQVMAEPMAAAGQRVVVGEPREAIPAPMRYEPADCTCLDGDCRADHGNE